MADLAYCPDTATPDEVSRVGECRLGIEIPMTKSRYAEVGLGFGPADTREAILDLNDAQGLHRLVSVDQDPNDDAALLTRWLPVGV